MPEIVRRASLVAQVADILRRDLQEGMWRDYLPGEHTLSERLQVSRPTLRAALELLRREGLILVSQGRRRRITSKSQRLPSRVDPKVVAVVAALDFHKLSPFSLFLISELQKRLHDAGYRIEVLAKPRFTARNLDRALTNTLAQTRAACWILLGYPVGVLRWLREQQARALIVGSGWGGEPFPFIGADSLSLARHAVGVFLRHGHSRITMILPRVNDAADSELERGFREGISLAGKHSSVTPRVVYHDTTVHGIRKTLNGIFQGPDKPSALLVARPKHVITVMSHLMDAGIRFPRDVSLISMGHDSSLDDMVPSVAHYDIDWNAFAPRPTCKVILTSCWRCFPRKSA